MQLSTAKAIIEKKSPYVVWTTGGTTKTEQATYCTLWDYTSTVMEDLKTGMIRILDDHANVKSIVWLI